MAALDAGADDYVTKPFGMDELLARLRAAVRRASPAHESRGHHGRLTVDLAAKQVIRGDGEDVRLTPTEWQLLEILVRNSGRLVTQRQLLREVWGPANETESNYLRVYLAQLRRKLEPEPSRPRYLLTESAWATGSSREPQKPRGAGPHAEEGSGSKLHRAGRNRPDAPSSRLRGAAPPTGVTSAGSWRSGASRLPVEQAHWRRELAQGGGGFLPAAPSRIQANISPPPDRPFLRGP